MDSNSTTGPLGDADKPRDDAPADLGSSLGPQEQPQSQGQPTMPVGQPAYTPPPSQQPVYNPPPPAAGGYTPPDAARVDQPPAYQYQPQGQPTVSTGTGYPQETGYQQQAYQQQPQQGYPQGYGTPPPPGVYPQGYAPPTAPAGSVAQPAKKSGVPVWVWVIGGVLLVFILGCVAIAAMFGMFVNTASKSITSGLGTVGAGFAAVGFTTAVEFGNYDQAHDYLTGGLASRYSAQTIRSKWEALGGGKLGSSSSVNTTIGDVRTSGDNVIVPWIITDSNGKSHTVDLYFGMVNEDYKITDAKPDLIPSP